jgi:hypothetical protein
MKTFWNHYQKGAKINAFEAQILWCIISPKISYSNKSMKESMEITYNFNMHGIVNYIWKACYNSMRMERGVPMCGNIVGILSCATERSQKRG